MSRLRMWREKVWWWAPALVFFGINLGLLSAYRLVYQGRVVVLEERIESRERELAQLIRRSTEERRLLETVSENRVRLQRFYESGLSRESERLTAIIAEVKDLASRVGLRPTSFTYPEEAIRDFGLVRRSIAFAVEGTYGQLRQFINLLELSDSFLILEEVGLSDSGSSGQRLRINLRVSTLFVGADGPPVERPERGSRPRART